MAVILPPPSDNALVISGEITVATGDTPQNRVCQRDPAGKEGCRKGACRRTQDDTCGGRWSCVSSSMAEWSSAAFGRRICGRREVRISPTSSHSLPSHYSFLRCLF